MRSGCVWLLSIRNPLQANTNLAAFAIKNGSTSSLQMKSCQHQGKMEVTYILIGQGIGNSWAAMATSGLLLRWLSKRQVNNMAAVTWWVGQRISGVVACNTWLQGALLLRAFAIYIKLLLKKAECAQQVLCSFFVAGSFMFMCWFVFKPRVLWLNFAWPHTPMHRGPGIYTCY